MKFLKLSCIIQLKCNCLNTYFIKKYKLDWHIKCNAYPKFRDSNEIPKQVFIYLLIYLVPVAVDQEESIEG